MIKFIYDNAEDETCLGLGVSRGNVDRLIQGKPIIVQIAELGNQTKIDGSVMIYFAETESKLKDAISEFIGPHTVINVDPKLDIDVKPSTKKSN